MMPLSTFNLLATVAIVFFLFAIIDYRNKVYANIASAIVSSLISGMLSLLIFIGAVQTDSGSYQISDTPTATLMLLIMIVSGIYAFFLVMEARDEYEANKEKL